MEPIHQYFLGERQAGLCAALLGLGSLLFTLWLFRSVSPFRAMMIPLGIVGLLQLGVGIGLYAKTPAQVAGVEAGLSQSDPSARAAAHRTETTRMERVQANFVIIKRVWLGLIVLGLGLAILGAPRSALIGVGLGILIQGAVMLAFDIFAEARGRTYFSFLQSSADKP
ncbi:MAG TPA: hypothetical protein PKI03_38870 [Pseudomonadota bacterium]|nr:hypothetical protein [Pseudomonadota bacterium]